MAHLEVRKFSSPDESRPFTNGRMEVVKAGKHTIGRGIFEPGWRWSRDMKPTAKTETCRIAHSVYVLSGSMHISMDDGQQVDLLPGDYAVIPPGHDAWTLGESPCVLVDYEGARNYAVRDLSLEEAQFATEMP